MSKQQPHNRIDETIHQRTRLAIMATLAGVKRLDFNELKVELGLTDGNLSTHLGALQRAGFVKITKVFRSGKPRTSLAMTAKGRKALERYINLLQGLLKGAT